MRAILTAIFIMLTTLCTLSAQKINIGYIYPAGAQRGSTQTIAIGGQSIATAQSVIVSGEGVTTEILPATAADKKGNRRKKGAISDEDNLQLAQSIKVKVTVAEDAELGIRDLKVVSATGVISNILYFEVGDYVDYVEREPNNTLSEANHIESLPVTINGYVEKSSVVGDMEQSGGGVSQERGGKDLFSFDAKRGDMLVAEVKARRFVPYLADAVPGWFQSVITIYDETGREVAYCDDYRLRIDPVIAYRVESAGRYSIKIHDSIYRGREDFVYRINLGVIPYVNSIYPLGGEATKRAAVELRGYNIGGKVDKISGEEVVSTSLNTSELDGGIHTIRYTNPKSRYISNEFSFNVGDGEEDLVLSDAEVGHDLSTARLITTSQTINSRIEEVGDEDWYCFDMERGGNIIISIIGRKLGSPIDARMVIYDSNGDKIEEADDVVDPSQGLLTHHADPELSIKLPKAGRYYIRVRETQNQGGVDYAYQLRVMEYQPSFLLNIEPSSLSIPQGGTSLFTLFAQRKYNFKGRINLKYEGLPEGFEVSAVQYAGNSKSMKIAISAPEDAELGRVNLKVLGLSSMRGMEPVSEEAKPSQVMRQAFYIDHLLNASEFRVDVTPAEPFTISLEPVEGDRIQLTRHGVTKIRVVIDRAEGFDDEIQIMKKLTPQGIFFSSITIPAGESEGILEVESPYWKVNTKSAKLMLLGTVNSSTQNRVAGQVRNTVNAAIMVNSRYTDIYMPTTKDPMTLEEYKRMVKLRR